MEQHQRLVEELHKPARRNYPRLSELQQDRVPSNLQTDQGKEFYNANFQNLMSRYHINH